MRSLPGFTLHRPATLDVAAALLAQGPSARAIAGGTDLVPNLRRGLHAPAALVDLASIAQLAGVRADADGGITIGACTTLAAIERDLLVARALPALAQAAQAVAGPAHRSAATLGGNLCQDTRCVFYNQGEWWRAANGWCLKRGGTTCHVAPQGNDCHAAFCSDLAPVLLVAGATVEIVRAQGTRRLPLAGLYLDDGAGHLSLAQGEVVTSVSVPASPGLRIAFGKVRSRGAMDFPLASAAVGAVVDNGLVVSLRVAMSGTNTHPVLIDGIAGPGRTQLDDALLARLRQQVLKRANPMRTTLTPANHRREAAAALVQRLVLQVAGQRQEEGTHG